MCSTSTSWTRNRPCLPSRSMTTSGEPWPKSRPSSSSCTALSVGSWISGQASLANRVESASRCCARFSTSPLCLAVMRHQTSPARRFDPFSSALKHWALLSRSVLWCSSSHSQPVMVCPKQEQPRSNQRNNHSNNQHQNLRKPRVTWATALQKSEQQPQENQPTQRGTTYLRYPVKALLLSPRAATSPCTTAGARPPRPGGLPRYATPSPRPSTPTP